jgi:excisionase family DNA binding protein
MFTIPLNTNSGIRIPARTPADKPEKPERKRTENIEPIGVSVKEAATKLGVHKDTFMVLVKTGKVRTVRINKRIIVSNQSLHDYVDGKKEPDNSAEKNDQLQGKKE